MKQDLKPEEKLIIRYSEFKLALLTVVLLFFIVFPFLLPARITIHQNIYFVIAVMIGWLSSAIIYLFAHIAKVKVRYHFLCYATVITDILFLSAILYILPGINSNYFFLYVFILIGASFYLDKELVIIAGVLSSFIIVIAFFAEFKFPISSSDWILFLARLFFILASTYFVYLFVLSFKDILAQKKKIQRYSDLNQEMLVHFSNQLRAPLPVIRDFIEQLFIEKAGPLNSKQKDILKLLHKSTEDLINESANTVYYNQMNLHELYIDKKKINLVEIINNAIIKCRDELLKRNINIIYQPKKKYIYIKSDKVKLLSIINVFINNAIMRIRGSSKIKISAKKSRFSQYVKIIISYKGEKLCLSEVRTKQNFDMFVSNKMISILGGNVHCTSGQNNIQKIIIILPS